MSIEVVNAAVNPAAPPVAATEALTGNSVTVETTATDEALAAASTKVDWLPDADADTAQFIGLKGWKSPQDILASYRNLEKMKGGLDPAKVIEIPSDDAAPEVKDAFFQKLGRPEKPEGYDVSKIESKEMAEAYKQLAFEKGIPKATAENLIEWFETEAGKVRQAHEQQIALQHEEQIKTLQRDWGASYEERANVVNEAASRFGMGDGELKALRQAMGPKGAMEFLYKIGSATGEATFRGAAPTGTGKMTPDQAKMALLQEGPSLMKAEMDPTNPARATAQARRVQLQRWAEGRG